jgi:hypothetical protein
VSAWANDYDAMAQRTGGLRATGSPSDFPTADELDAARCLDELCHEINIDHNEFVVRIAFAVDQRLTRMHAEAMSTTEWNPNDSALDLSLVLGGSR